MDNHRQKKTCTTGGTGVGDDLVQDEYLSPRMSMEAAKESNSLREAEARNPKMKTSPPGPEMGNRQEPNLI